VRFNAHLKNMEMAGGEHIMCSPQLLNKPLVEATSEKIEAERRRFKSMCFILCADETRYAKLNDELKRRV